MSDREWVDPKTGTKVCAGDRWKDKDVRGGERFVDVERVDAGFVYVMSRPRTTKDAFGRTKQVRGGLRSRIRLPSFVRGFVLAARCESKSEPADDGALKPCPFCGGTNLMVDALIAAIECLTCATGGPTPDQDAPRESQEAEARRLWNTRAVRP